MNEDEVYDAIATVCKKRKGRANTYQIQDACNMEPKELDIVLKNLIIAGRILPTIEDGIVVYRLARK